jgi:thiol:disulfide interchange protein DsbA
MCLYPDLNILNIFIIVILSTKNIGLYMKPIWALLLTSALFLMSCSPRGTEVGGVRFIENVHYTTLKYKIDRPANEVLEFFWFGCPHCYEGESYINQWLSNSKSNAFLTKAHSQLNNKWMFDAFVFYSVHGMPQQDEIYKSFFEQRHKDMIHGEDDLNKFLAPYNIELADLKKSYSQQSTQDYQKQMGFNEKIIDSHGVPAFLVGGQYVVKLDGLSDCGGWNCLGDLLDFLVSKSNSGSSK